MNIHLESATKDITWFIDEFLQLKKDIPINQGILNDIFNNHLHLKHWDTTIDGPNLLKEELITTSVNLIDIVNQIKDCCITRHPVICRVVNCLRKSKYNPGSIRMQFERFHKDKWSSIKEKIWKLDDLVAYTLHTMYIYELIVKIGIKNVKWQDTLLNYYKRLKRNHSASIYRLWKITNTFSLVKSESVQMQYPIWAKIRKISCKIAQLRGNLSHKKRIKYAKYLEKYSNETRFGLSLNIMEAVIADRLHYKVKDNAATGMALIANPIGDVWADCGSQNDTARKNAPIKFQMPGAWSDLYLSWNLNFVSHFSNPHIVFAKLLQPTVFCAQPEDFIYPRALSLLVSVQCYMLDMLTSREIPTKIVGNEFILKHASVNRTFANRMSIRISDHTIEAWGNFWKKIKNTPDFLWKTVRTIVNDPFRITRDPSQFSQDSIHI
jgi:hypothetical protein